MSARTKIFIACIIILGLVWGAYQFLGYFHHPKVQPPATTSTLNYACTEGTLKATYGSTEVTLTLPDGTVTTLPQTISGSGTRYEKGNLTFVTKGDYAFLQEGGKTTYSNCVLSTDVATGSGMQIFTDGSQTFSFMHPTGVPITGGDIGYTTDWRVNTQTLGLLLVKGVLPSSLQPQTNFAGATFTVGTSSDPQAITNCLSATNGETGGGTTTINGTKYHVFTLGDAGAGNFYETTSYRTLHNSQCYSVEYTIHSTNIGNYSPDQGISSFDKQPIIDELEGMVKSFTFLQ